MNRKKSSSTHEPSRNQISLNFYWSKQTERKVGKRKQTDYVLRIGYKNGYLFIFDHQNQKYK